MSTLTTNSINQDEIDTYVILTPVSPKNESWENFKYEMARAQEGKSLLWSYNGKINEKVLKAKYFGFVEQSGGKDNITLFPIKDILEKTRGRIHWSDDHNSNTIVMKPLMSEWSWKKYKKDLGGRPETLRGTKCRKLPINWRLS